MVAELRKAVKRSFVYSIFVLLLLLLYEKRISSLGKRGRKVVRRVMEVNSSTMLRQKFKNKTTEHILNETFIVNKDEFGTPGNEPHLYLRSAYIDYRLSPPKVWVLAVAGRNLELQNVQCYFGFNTSGNIKQRIVTVNSSVYSHETWTGCFYELVAVHCDLGKQKPNYISIAFKKKGR